MMNKELFEGPVGDYCIARNTIKFLFNLNICHFKTIQHTAFLIFCFFDFLQTRLKIFIFFILKGGNKVKYYFPLI